MTDTSLQDVLERIGTGLRRDGFEGAVFLLPSGAVIAFTSTTWRAHNCRYNIGRRPLVNRVREALEDEKANAEAWLAQLRAKIPRKLPRPATLWNRPELVITEVMGRDRLVTIFEHPESWWPERLAEVAEQIGIYDVDDLERIFRSATKRALPDDARRHYLEKVAPITSGT